MTDHKKNKIAFSFLELEILKQLGKGKLYKEIADYLGISFFEVTLHVRSIFTKLDPDITGEERDN